MNFDPVPVNSPELDFDADGCLVIENDDAELAELVAELWAKYDRQQVLDELSEVVSP